MTPWLPSNLLSRLASLPLGWRSLYVAILLVLSGVAHGMISHQDDKIQALSAGNEKLSAAVEKLNDRVNNLRTTGETTVPSPTPMASDPATSARLDEFKSALVAAVDCTAALEAELAAAQRSIQNMAETVPALRESLEGRLLALEEQEPPAFDTSALTQQLAAQAKGLADIAAGLSQLEKEASPDSSGVSEELGRLESSAILAFQTLDQQFQNILGRLDEMAERDQELGQAQEAARVALQSELNQWRQRHTPLVWGLAAQLSGETVRFSESTNLADGAAAQAALAQVATLLLASDASVGIRVVGYADFDGTDAESNRITSQKRADYILEQLTRLGAPKERMLAVGKATEDRVIDSDAAGNGNRRVIFEPFLLKDTSG